MFIVRVELRDVPDSKSRDVYDKFHAAMEKAGFTKQIKGGDGKTYRLPDSTYTASGTDSNADVRDLVKKLADATGYKSGVIVFSGDGSAAWTGLDVVSTSGPYANA